jgi:hypothetical protein
VGAAAALAALLLAGSAFASQSVAGAKPTPTTKPEIDLCSLLPGRDVQATFGVPTVSTQGGTAAWACRDNSVVAGVKIANYTLQQDPGRLDSETNLTIEMRVSKRVKSAKRDLKLILGAPGDGNPNRATPLPGVGDQALYRPAANLPVGDAADYPPALLVRDGKLLLRIQGGPQELVENNRLLYIDDPSKLVMLAELILERR